MRHGRSCARTAYALTEGGEELRPLIEMLGTWGQRWAPSHLEEGDLDAGLLMWDVRRRIGTAQLPEERTVVQFEFSDVPGAKGHFWLVGSRDEVELC